MGQTIVIFGASGDLTSRKLIPALFNLYCKGRLPDGTRIVGVSRSEMTSQAWRDKLQGTTGQFSESGFDESKWSLFSQLVEYFPGDVNLSETFTRLDAFLSQLEGGALTGRMFYLAMAPQTYQTIVEQLGRAGMAKQSDAASWRRIVLEKPFGTDRASAIALNAFIHQWFDESQIYRIDHYLGKETVANIMVLRFANTIFEPIWNRNHIDNVQITAAEETIIGRRAGYYEKSGVLRDMFQNHLLQLLILTAMEAPSRFEPDIVRDEKVKVLRAIRPMTMQTAATDSLRSQYRTYRDEPDVDPRSQTATFGIVKFYLENWRWQGVPFYLRSGKAMSCRTTQIVIQFKKPPHFIFDSQKNVNPEANKLVLQIQPAEGIKLYFQTKTPDAGMAMRQTSLDFNFQSGLSATIPDSYQRLLLDVIQGDASLFARADEVELAWSVIDPIQQAWDSGVPPLSFYESGMWGPEQAFDWMEQQDGRQWFDVCPVI
ncbi:MAG: glucose-6-phosphate dehydrogenase [Thermoguttaceae bacterium]|nr:glucose-6-phosphate dehydrogenase [Thermoguttaceae bacterium]